MVHYSKTYLMLNLFSQFIEHYKAPGCDEPKARGTIINYEKRYKKLSIWLKKEKLSEIQPEQFTIGIAKKFFREMLTVHGRNYSVRVTKMVGQVLEWGVNEEIIKVNPLHYYRLKRDNKKKIIYLTPDELTRVENYVFKSPFMNRVKDLFLWSCYTGMDYGDTMAVTMEHLYLNPKDKRLYIIKPRNKKGKEALIPYFSKTRELWEKYNFKLPKISNGTYNRIIKEVMWVIDVEKRISTHTGRKTFAMIKLNNEGYSIAAVSAMLGHKNIRTTEEYYAQVNLDLVSNELNRLNAA